MPSTDRGGAARLATPSAQPAAKAGPTMMKAIAVFPGKPNSMHLASCPSRRSTRFPDGRGVLVKVLRVGVDGTDKEINAAEYGAAPPGYDFLVIGHESFGRVEAVGPERDRARSPATTSWPRCAGRARASTTGSAPTT